jgi:putative flippase GtrA
MVAGPAMMRLIRYFGVSVVNVVVTVVVLVVGIELFDMSGGSANVLAVCVAAAPAYYLYRRWVWAKEGPNHFWREIVPFWTYAVLGLVISTGVVLWADAEFEGSLPVTAANIGSFFVLWVAKFFFLDRLLFGERGG